MGRPPIGKYPMTAAERQRRSRAALAVPAPAEPEQIAGLKARIAELEQEQRNRVAPKKKGDRTD
jgi:hypothetical protein